MIKTELINEKDIEVGKDYVIIDVSDFTSPKNDKGYKVTLNSTNPKDKQVYSSILWIRPKVGLNSKLGAFICALSEFSEDGDLVPNYNTDTWLNRKIHVDKWTEKNRKVTALED